MRAAEDGYELQQKINSGEYYEDALEWYNFIYISPVIQRTLLVTVTVFCIFINLLAVYSIYNFLPLTVKIPLVVAVDDVGGLYATIKKLGASDEEPTHAVSSYLLQEYVESRENYRYENLGRNASFMKQLSSPEVYNKYVGYMDLRNAASPESRLKQSGSIEAKNITIDLPVPTAKDEGKKHTASVTFETVENSPAGSVTNKYRADISFSITKITLNPVDRKFPPLDFQVEDYIVTPLTGQKEAQKPS